MKKHPGNSHYPEIREFPNAAYKYSEMDPSLSVVLDLLHNPNVLAHRVGTYTGCNILYGDGSVEFKRDRQLELYYGSTNKTGVKSLVTEPIEWRKMLRALE